MIRLQPLDRLASLLAITKLFQVVAIIPDKEKILINNPKFFTFLLMLTFPFPGEYAGFDENEPTSRSGGKGLVVRRLKEQYGYQRLIIIGDGATDAEACPPADGFIGE